MTKSRIDDGYTLKRYVNGSFNLFEPLHFSFRPLEPLERAELMQVTRGMKEVALYKCLAEVIVDRLVEWDAKEWKHTNPSAREEGGPMEITRDNMLRIQAHLQMRLHAIICYQSDGGDPEVVANKPIIGVDADGTPAWLAGPLEAAKQVEQQLGN